MSGKSTDFAEKAPSSIRVTKAAALRAASALESEMLSPRARIYAELTLAEQALLVLRGLDLPSQSREQRFARERAVELTSSHFHELIAQLAGPNGDDPSQ